MSAFNINDKTIINKYKLNKEIYEGWTVKHFIINLDPLVDMIMKNDSYQRPFINRKELANWCSDNQPYYKKVIPEVVAYFADKYNIN